MGTNLNVPFTQNFGLSWVRYKQVFIVYLILLINELLSKSGYWLRVVRKDMDGSEHERLSNFTLRHSTFIAVLHFTVTKRVF